MSVVAAFVHPGLLWGLGLVSVPIIIHLITRHRYRIIEWAAMEFLLEAERKSRRRVRIENLLLLLARMALIGLIPFILARPMASALGIGWLAGAFRSEERILVIDDSMSMGHVEAGRSALDRARGAVRAMLERIAGRAARGAVTIVRSSRPDAPLRRGAYVDHEHLPDLAGDIEAIEPTDTRIALERLAVSVADMIAEAPPRAGRTIVLASDFRRADWAGAPAALREAFRRLAGDPDHPVRLIFLDVGSRDRENLAVTNLALSRRIPVAGVPVGVALTVSNLGASPARGVRTALRAGEAEIPGPAIEEIPPGERRAVRFPYVFAAPGAAVLEGRIEDDRLPADNRRVAVVEVLEGVRALLVDGAPSSEPFAGETDYLAFALDPGGEVASGIAVEVVTEDGLPDIDLERYDLVVLANVYTVPVRAAEALTAYVRGGGGLAIFLGDAVDAALYGKHLAPLLPAAIGERVDRPASGAPFHLRPALDHPALRMLRGDGAALLERVAIDSFLRLEPGPQARVLVRFTDPDASPAIVERDLDAGRVVLCATAADRDWGDWPRHPSYLVFLHDLVPYLGRARGTGRNIPAGSPIDFPLDLARFTPKAVLRGPRYPEIREQAVRAEPGGEGFRLRVTDTRTAGPYTLILQKRGGGTRTESFAVAPDPDESNLEPAGEALLRKILEDVPFDYIRDTAGLGARDAGGWELSGLLLGAFLALALVELFMAWTFGRRGGTA